MKHKKGGPSKKDDPPKKRGHHKKDASPKPHEGKEKKKSGKKKKAHKKNLKKMTDEERAQYEKERIAQLQEEHDRIEKEKYEKYINELRQQNYRAALLSAPLKSFSTMCNAHRKFRRDQLEIEKWNNYLKCSCLPNVHDPPAIRAFIYRWKYEIQEDIKNFFSWVLDVDERSILTQDISKENKCYSKLYNEQPIIGERYIPRIDQCLELLSKLELVLRDRPMPDLIEIKKELRTQLRNVLDYFSYRILSNVERDMVKINSCTANHNFKSNSFCSSIWTSRPVPQVIKSWRAVGVTELEFPVVDTIILMPNEIETDGYSYRGLLMNYDHYSDMAQCSKLNITIPPTPDLRVSNEMEWNKKEEIMHEKLDQMKEERLKWEKKEEERQLKEEESRKSRNKSGGVGPRPQQKPEGKKHKTAKAKLPPMVVTETTVVDVTEDYLKYEEDLLTQQRAAMSPDLLNLIEGEVNLREFQILGGIYAFHYLIRPEQYTQLKQQFLYKLNIKQILKYAEFLATEEIQMVEIRIKLSENVNWWFVPIACYWQPWEESEEFYQLSPALQDFHKNYEKYMAIIENLLFRTADPKPNYDIVKCLNDFTLGTLPRNIDFHQLMHDYLVPRMPINFKFQVELDAEKEIRRREEMRAREAAMDKKERNQKRRDSFNIEMEEYLVKIKADAQATVIQMEKDCDQFYVEERMRMINQGDNELRIDRYLKRQREIDEAKRQEVMDDAISKYRDYYEELFKERILNAEAEEATVVSTVNCHVEKNSPRDLFPFKPRQLPLKMINDETVYNFDVPNEIDASACDAAITENELLSTFFRYLILLYEKNKPFFKDVPVKEVTETVPHPDELIQIEPEAKTSSESKLKKPKTPIKKVAKKSVTPQKIAKKPKTPKKSAKSEKVAVDPTTPSNSPRPASKKGGRSRSVKKSPKSKSSRKSPSSGSSKKSSKSPRKKSKKSHKGKKQEGTEDQPLQSELDADPSRQMHIKKSRKDRILNLVPHFPGKWVRNGINMLDFDIDTREVKFQISRFGTFGFAMPKYCNFPLKYWEIYPNAYKKQSVLFKIIGVYAEIKIEITDNGYAIERIVPNNINFIADHTAMDYRDFKNFLIDCGFNIFPDRDAGIYVDGITEKHRSMEDHTYYCLCQFTLTYYFRMSEFNRVSDHRTGVFEYYETRENVEIPDTFNQIMVTPQNCYFVAVSEVTAKTGEKSLNYKMEPKEQEYYPDAYNLLMADCNELSKRSHGQMKQLLRYNVARLLCAIRPLSFA